MGFISDLFDNAITKPSTLVPPSTGIPLPNPPSPSATSFVPPGTGVPLARPSMTSRLGQMVADTPQPNPQMGDALRAGGPAQTLDPRLARPAAAQAPAINPSPIEYPSTGAAWREAPNYAAEGSVRAAPQAAPAAALGPNALDSRGAIDPGAPSGPGIVSRLKNMFVGSGAAANGLGLSVATGALNNDPRFQAAGATPEAIGRQGRQIISDFFNPANQPRTAAAANYGNEGRSSLADAVMPAAAAAPAQDADSIPVSLKSLLSKREYAGLKKDYLADPRSGSFLYVDPQTGQKTSYDLGKEFLRQGGISGQGGGGNAQAASAPAADAPSSAAQQQAGQRYTLAEFQDAQAARKELDAHPINTVEFGGSSDPNGTVGQIKYRDGTVKPFTRAEQNSDELRQYAELHNRAGILNAPAPVQIIRPGGERTVAAPEAGYKEVPEDIANTGQTGKYIQGLANARLQNLDQLSGQRLKNEGDVATAQEHSRGTIGAADVTGKAHIEGLRLGAESAQTVEKMKAETAKNTLIPVDEDTGQKDVMGQPIYKKGLVDARSKEFVTRPQQQQQGFRTWDELKQAITSGAVSKSEFSQYLQQLPVSERAKAKK